MTKTMTTKIPPVGLGTWPLSVSRGDILCARGGCGMWVMLASELSEGSLTPTALLSAITKHAPKCPAHQREASPA